MAYQVLARKWRPTRFADVVGQRHVTTTLENAIRAGRLAHGFLFCGPRGVGKTTTARILAKCLNCETAQNGPVVEPCNQCTSCLETAEGRSLDVLEIDGASNRGIDEIRDLRENVRYAPSGGRAKVYIIDEVHMLTKEAFNALLKTLEEPPPSVYFVFATTEVHKIPATIRSRCQRYDFHRISTDQIRVTLEQLAKNEKFEVEADAIQELARHAEGGLRDAQSLLDQAAAVGEGKITVEGVRSLLGEAEEEALLAIVEAVAAGDTGSAFVQLQALLDRGLDPGRVATSLTRTFRDLLVARTAADQAAALGVRADLADEYRRVAGGLSVTHLTAMLSLASRAVADLRRSARPRLSLEVALARLCRLEDPGEMAALVARVEALSGGAGGDGPSGDPARMSPRPPAPAAPAVPRDPAPQRSSAPGRATAKTPRKTPPSPRAAVEPPAEDLPPLPEEEPPEYREFAADESAPSSAAPAGAAPVIAAAPVVRDASLDDLWQKLVARVGKQRHMLGSFLKHGAPTSWDGATLSVVFENNYYEGQVQRGDALALIHQELSEIAGHTAAFRARVGALPVGARPVDGDATDAGAAPRTSPRDLLETNPGLRRAIHDLGGQLLPGGS